VNSSVYLDPKHLPQMAHAASPPDALPKPLSLILTPEWAEPTSKNFQRLSSILRLYADYLRAWLPSFKFLGRHGIRPQVLLILALIKLVKDRRKRPHYEQIATLLEAAFAAAGQPRNFGADDLKKLEKNNVMLWALLHPELFAPTPTRS
jgi:hypothetical protein